MKSNTLFAVCLAVFSGCSVSLAAGQQPCTPPSSQSIPSESVPPTGGWPSPEEAVARMSNNLNLS
jgi:hypothetical protein